MVEFLVVSVSCTFLVLFLFVIVGFLNRKIRGSSPSRFEVAVERWWIILALIEVWLLGIMDLPAISEFANWEIADYARIICLAAITYFIIITWKRLVKDVSK